MRDQLLVLGLLGANVSAAASANNASCNFDSQTTVTVTVTGIYSSAREGEPAITSSGKCIETVCTTAPPAAMYSKGANTSPAMNATRAPVSRSS